MIKICLISGMMLFTCNIFAQSVSNAGRIKCEHGNFALEAGHYDDAIKIFEECIKQYDSIPDALYGAASGYYYTSNFPKAKTLVNILLNNAGPEYKSRSQYQDAFRLAAMIEEGEGSTFEMVFVKGGTFVMGCREGVDVDCEAEERPSHNADAHDFFIGKYEVTQSQWKLIMGQNPSSFTGCDNCPVENISWDEIQVFIDKLNHKFPSMNFRLPSEVEWEYAARGGNLSKSYKYCGSNIPDEVAWYDKNSGNKTHPVGTKKPNELGIYDMGGNVWEWTADWFFFYAGPNMEANKGVLAKSHKTDRGGCWQYSTQYVRPGTRGGLNTIEKSGDLGFRLARDAK